MSRLLESFVQDFTLWTCKCLGGSRLTQTTPGPFRPLAGEGGERNYLQGPNPDTQVLLGRGA